MHEKQHAQPAALILWSEQLVCVFCCCGLWRGRREHEHWRSTDQQDTYGAAPLTA